MRVNPSTRDLCEARNLLATLNHLSGGGFKLWIDHFGAGRSSLACLKKLQVDALTIDNRCLLAMANHAADAKSVPSTIEPTPHTRLAAAEGVTTVAILEQLRALQCDEAQGPVVSRPVPALEHLACAARWTATPPQLQGS